MKKYINPTIDIVKVDLLSTVCTSGEEIKGDSGNVFGGSAPARKLYV